MRDRDAPWDILIVGGGSAGCVLASRLSEDATTRVLLIEAGPDLPPGGAPADIASPYPGRAYFNGAWVWPGLSASLGTGAGNQPAAPRPYEQARILGGGSSINGLGTNRGAPHDYDEWAERGATGWGWTDVLPFFRRIETDHDFGGPLHGQDGPLPIRRMPRASWSSYARAVEDMFAAMGYPARHDQNGTWEDGVFPTSINTDAAGQRAGVAAAYLTQAVRRRPNLTIRTGVTVRDIVLAGGRADGVRVMIEGAPRLLRAHRVIVSAGAIGTPVLLMRSGIGPAAHLAARGICVRHDLPGVGQNLQEHPSIGLSGYLRPAARMPAGEHYHLPGLLRWSSGLEGEPPGDMHTAIVARSGWHAVGRRIGSLFSWVNRTHSRGEVRLAATPEAPPDIDFRLLSDRRDLLRLMAAFRLAVRALGADSMRDSITGIFPSTYSARVRRYLRPTRRNGVLMGLAAPLMDASPALRARVLAGAIESEADAVMLAADDALLEAHLRRHVGGVWHPCGTCAMGRPADTMAVTDPGARVRGVEGLMVCDASLMPRSPSANINVPILMMAEKIADRLRRDRSA